MQLLTCLEANNLLMTDTSYYIAIWIGIGIGIGIGKIFSSVLGIKSIGKKWYQSTITYMHYNSNHC